MRSKEIPEYVCEDVIDHNQHGRKNEVNEAIVCVLAHRPGRGGYKQTCKDYPTKQPKLILEKPLLEAEDEAQEANDEEGEADEVMIGEEVAD